MPPVLFLDIDGVLLPFGGSRNGDGENRERKGYHFSGQCMHALGVVLDAVPETLVCLSSTWRCGGGQKAIVEEFQRFGGTLANVRSFTYTTSLTQHDHRQWEIAMWLELNATSLPVTTWVALDDEELVEPVSGSIDDHNARFRERVRGHVVKCDSKKGFTHRQAMAAIAILRGAFSKEEQRSVPKIPALPSAQFHQRVCRHWWRKRDCRMGDKCRFAHPDVTTLPSYPRSRYRQQTRNAGRIGIFRRWLLRTFGKERLASGSGVMDVAGGKGMLAFELLNVHGIEGTVVDPRPLQLQRNAKMWRHGFYHKRSRVADLAHFEPPLGPCDEPSLPKHIRAFLEEQLWRRPEGREAESEALFRANLERAEGCTWGKRGLEHETSSGEASVGDDGDFVGGLPDDCNSLLEAQAATTTVRNAYEAFKTLQACSCICGMHPDQAAGPIVEMGVALGKSFAVVPCCVYSSEFPKRKLKSGKPVTSYNDLLDYLQEQDPERIKREKLPYLEGKNIVLYRVV